MNSLIHLPTARGGTDPHPALLHNSYGVGTPHTVIPTNSFGVPITYTIVPVDPATYPPVGVRTAGSSGAIVNGWPAAVVPGRIRDPCLNLRHASAQIYLSTVIVL